jgi:glycosyltransferase involved in cell wall biosynthesis
VIATASEGPSELIAHDKNGLVTPIDDVHALSSAIDSLLSDPNKMQELADNGFLEYAEHYSRDVIIQQYKDFFQSITTSN